MTWRLPAEGRVTSSYGPRKLTGAVSNFHAGTDLGSKRRPVHAAESGTVRALWRTIKGAWVVDVQHPGDVRTRYIHMELDDIVVGIGDTVASGQRIGRSGKSGTSAAHLHFEVLVDGLPVDPEPFMTARGVTLGTGVPGAEPVGLAAFAAVAQPGADTDDTDDTEDNPEEDDMAGLVDDARVQAVLKALVMEALVETDLAVATRSDQFGRNAQAAALARARVEAHHILTGAAGGVDPTLRQIRGAIAALTAVPTIEVMRDLDDETLEALSDAIKGLPAAIDAERARRGG